MKRFFALFMIAVLTLCCAPALAETDDFDATQEAPASADSAYTYYPEIEAFVGEWQSGDYALEIVHMMDDDSLLNCIVTRMDDEHNGVRWIYDACAYDDVGNALASMEIGMKFTILVDDNGELISNEQIFTDGAAAFALNDDGTLTWTDFKETPGENEIVFERANG